jgi:hypothetical protein
MSETAANLLQRAPVGATIATARRSGDANSRGLRRTVSVFAAIEKRAP